MGTYSVSDDQMTVTAPCGTVFRAIVFEDNETPIPCYGDARSCHSTCAFFGQPPIFCDGIPCSASHRKDGKNALFLADTPGDYQHVMKCVSEWRASRE